MIKIFINRIIRAAKLDVQVYEEVEADVRAGGQAMLVVVLTGIASGIGALEVAGVGGIFKMAFADIVGWFMWAYVTYFFGTKIFPEPQTQSNPGELLRTIGFSRSPGFIRIFGFIPGLAQIVFPVAFVWMLVSMVIAVRQALDYKSTFRAVGVCIIGGITYSVILFFVFLFFGRVEFFQ